MPYPEEKQDPLDIILEELVPGEKQDLIEAILEEILPIPEKTTPMEITSMKLERQYAAIENGLDDMDVPQLKSTLEIVRNNIMAKK